ncbi:hypothetical protein, partial [Mycobacterium persicum]|uniref:hypothetical protein n=1 Tax=Mycobacterium persicum TaxID=1487726 RepID=UPI001C3E72B6
MQYGIPVCGIGVCVGEPVGEVLATLLDDREGRCFLYPSEAADAEDSVDLGGRSIFLTQKCIEKIVFDIFRRLKESDEFISDCSADWSPNRER